MMRTVFYVLLFPPAFMNLLLVQAGPSSLPRYFLAGYLIAALPAVAIAVTDEMLARASVTMRAAWCGLAGLLVSPAAFTLLAGASVMGFVTAALSGGLAAFLCTLVFARYGERTEAAMRAIAVRVRR